MRFMKTSLHLEVQQKAPGAQRPDQVVIQRGKMFICLLAVSPPQQELRRSNCFCTKLMIHTLIALWDNAMETLTFANQNIPSLCFFSQIKWLDLIILLVCFFFLLFWPVSPAFACEGWTVFGWRAAVKVAVASPRLGSKISCRAESKEHQRMPTGMDWRAPSQLRWWELAPCQPLSYQLSAMTTALFSAVAGAVRKSQRENPQAFCWCSNEAVKEISQGWKLGEGKRKTTLLAL